MVIILKNTAAPQQVGELIRWLEDSCKVKTNLVEGVHSTIIGLIGDTLHMDTEAIMANDCVESVQRVQEPYKNANRKFHPDDTVIDVCSRKIGGNKTQIIAGPCSVESEKQLMETAIACKQAGATMLRGGAFKPRTSPYSFQGLREEGIKLLLKAKKETGLPVVTEIMSLAHIDMFTDVDVIQVGARNMYIMSEGNSKVILCERGIRTFETMTRNTLDISAVALLKQRSHLPVVVDPSHATGLVKLVEPMSLAAVAAGCDGLEIEVHCDPKSALSDGAQQLTPKAFCGVMEKIKALAGFMGKDVDEA